MSVIERLRTASLPLFACALVVFGTRESPADCGTASTFIWLSPLGETTQFADTPLMNVADSARLYLWGRPAAGETVTDLALDIQATSAVTWTAALLDNPQVDVVDGKPRRRYEHTPPSASTDTKLTNLQGFTLGERIIAGAGWGALSQELDPLYRTALDAWRLGEIELSAVADTELSLQLSPNGVQGIDAQGEPTPVFGLVFGDATDPPLCNLLQPGESSDTTDAIIRTEGITLTAPHTHTGSYWQGDGAVLTLALNVAAPSGQLKLTGAASLAGRLELEMANIVDPQTLGESDAWDLITATSLSGMLDHVVTNGTLWADRDPQENRIHHHAGDGLFRTVQRLEDRVVLRNYRALAGDADGDGEVNFPDFLSLSTHFNQPGSWTEGDFDGDGHVQFGDFLVLANQFGTATNIASVPEPRGLLVMWGVITYAIGRRRHR